MSKKNTPENLPAKPQGTAVAVGSADDFAEYAGAGMQNVGANDVLIPRLTILQSLSPQVNSKKSEYIPGAKVGDICDVATGDLFSDGIIFVPAYYRKDWLEWAPRASGKGLVAIHPSDAALDGCTRNERNQYINAAGNLIAETAQIFGFNLSADMRRSFIPFASTQLKKSRQWMTLAQGEKLKRGDGTSFTPPLFYRAYNLTATDESNAQGDWSGWKITRGPSLPELPEIIPGLNWQELRADCAALIQQILKGEARADTSGLQQEGSDEEGAM